ncbi:DUF4112 domain-containing protein [Primorskyibacter flagellatus]|uniref:DUF4112 domain-containing protein n=1 Tax=Primorskyibacter flagellatus TaxID=1387277 RepID=UPI003A8F9ADB
MSGMPDSPQAEHDRRACDKAEKLARRMDSAFRVPLTPIRLGWDSVLGLIPGVGDTLTLAPAVYIMHLAHRAGVPKTTLTRMAINSGADWLIGLVPLFGDLLDVGYKSNIRNAALLRAHVDAKHGSVSADAPRVA